MNCIVSQNPRGGLRNQVLTRRKVIFTFIVSCYEEDGGVRRPSFKGLTTSSVDGWDIPVLCKGSLIIRVQRGKELII